jgi:hypothetical protein
MTQGRHIEYNWIRGVEALEEYEPGGYHPIMVGDTLSNGRCIHTLTRLRSWRYIMITLIPISLLLETRGLIFNTSRTRGSPR